MGNVGKTTAYMLNPANIGDLFTGEFWKRGPILHARKKVHEKEEEAEKKAKAKRREESAAAVLSHNVRLPRGGYTAGAAPLLR